MATTVLRPWSNRLSTVSFVSDVVEVIPVNSNLFKKMTFEFPGQPFPEHFITKWRLKRGGICRFPLQAHPRHVIHILNLYFFTWRNYFLPLVWAEMIFKSDSSLIAYQLYRVSYICHEKYPKWRLCNFETTKCSLATAHKSLNQYISAASA